MAATSVSLRELADLAIGTPEVGAVNFTALHTLIVAMLKNLHLQDTQVDFRSLSPKQSHSSEALRASLGTPQIAATKERRRSSIDRTPVRTLESQVKDLGGQVQDLSRQLRTMESHVQSVVTHVQHFAAQTGGLSIDTPEWLEEQEVAPPIPGVATPTSKMAAPVPGMATPTPGMPTKVPGMATPTPGMPTKVPGMATPMPRMAMLPPEKAQIGVTKIRMDSPQAVDMIQNVLEDVKTLKEAHEKVQENLQEFPELMPQKLLQRIEGLEKNIQAREQSLKLMSRRLSVVPTGEDVTMVTWEELEQAITDGWKTSRAGSESTVALPRRKRQTSVTSSGASIRHLGVDEALDSAGGLGPRQTPSGTSGSGHPSERSRVTSTTGFPGREQHPRVREEAGLAKTHHLPTFQLRRDSDPHRPGEQHGSAHPRRAEREAHPGPVRQDLPSARDGRRQASPDPSGGVHGSPGLLYARPDQHGLGSPGLDQFPLPHPSTYPHGLVPPSTSQLTVVPPGMDKQGLVAPDLGPYGLAPALVPGADWQGSQTPRTDQPGMAPLSTYQYGVRFFGVDQRGMEWPGMDERGVGPLGTDPHGLAPVGIDQQGHAASGVDQQGLALPGVSQHGLAPPLTYQQVSASPGLMQVATGQQALIQPSSETPGLGQPGTERRDVARPGTRQPDMAQPDADQSALVQPGTGQPGLVQPGVERSFVQPGASQPGSVQPAVDRRSLTRPGAGQPGVDQPGLVQPGTGQPGLVQPGVGQPGLVQPGAVQPGLVQPGVGQPSLIQPGTGQPGLVQPGTGQPGLVQPGLVHPGVGQPGLVQPGVGQPGLVQLGMAQRGLVQPGLVQPGVGQPGLVQPGAVQPGLVQPGAVQPGLVQPGVDQHGMVQPGEGQPGLVQPGAVQPGLVQPGVGQRGLVQPGLVQPGVGQHGLVQPGTVQPGLVQPGVDQHGVVQPGEGQPGLVQPGAVQPGLVQPGVGQRGLVQPGLVQPGVGQRGLVQPDTVQPGSVQPGTGQHGLVQPDVGQRGLTQPGEVHPGVQPVMDRPGLVQPGLDQRDLFQPSVYQRGLVQPDTSQLDFVQPGMDPRGLLQPSTDPRGLVRPGSVQPGMYPHSLVQPGVYPPGLAQPGAYPPGLAQPGAYPRGSVRPGAYTHDFTKLGTDQHGVRQPGADQRGSTPSGTELRGSPTFQQDSAGFLSPYPYQPGPVPPGRGQHGQVSPLVAVHGLTSPGIAQEDLAPAETYREGLPPPGTDQRGPAPLSTDVASAGPDQEHLVSPGPPGPQQRDQVRPVRDSRGLTYPGPHGPGYQGADQPAQEGLGPKQPGLSLQIPTSQDATFARSADDVAQDPLEQSDFQRERKDSLDRVAPSFPLAVETFRLMGELVGLYVELKEQMKGLDEEQSGQTELEKIQFLLSLMMQKTVPPDLQEQLKTLKTLTKEIQEEKAKMQKILEAEQHLEMGKEPKASQLGLQLGILRVTVADIEKELAELRESQERGKVSMEHSVSEASIYLQDQLDKLRTIIESMLASSSTLLSMSMAPEKTLITLAPGQIDPQATCPACSLDVSHQVSTLVQRYEQLQDMVSNLAAARPSKKSKLQSQDEELLGRVQSAILQVQGDCEKLNITTSNLIEDHRQKQKDIDVLYQGLQKLEKEKANREHLEMEIDVKADKSALAAKVSRVQFDATTEQLNHMMQELVAKMSGQEQDWKKILDRLLTEMDNKLDRLELDPVKHALEDRWKALRQQLKERPPLYQADEAAAMRRQLLAHFHCLSCDRPLETPVTGQVLPVTPVGLCLPGHRSTRPYTIFELEQVRQQSRNLKPGGPAGPRGDLAPMERSVGRLRSMHCKMLKDIEKVQVHFGGSVQASSQMIRELLQARCLGSPCYRRVPDVADYTYSTVPRRCGGSHTLTYPYRRLRLQHLSPGLYPSEETQAAMKHDEVDILGLDGHIYKGRMDTRLPGIPHRDNSGVSRHKAKPPRSHTHRQQSLSDSSQLPSRPQSTQMLAGNTSAPTRQQTDRPDSSEGRLSQPSAAQLPSASEMAAGRDLPVDVPPGEGLEEPTRGPRSTTTH